MTVIKRLFVSILFISLLCIVASADGNNTNPTAHFSANVTSGYVPLDVQFNDSSINATSWSWNFEDGNGSILQNPEHIYSTLGDYNVNLTVANESNATNSTFVMIHALAPVVQTAPVAAFTTNSSSGVSPLTVQFTNTSAGTPTTLNWDFGDGNSSNVSNPIHTYYIIGNYSVTLNASNNYGYSNVTHQITVTNVTINTSLAAIFTVNTTSGAVPLTVLFTDKSTGSPTNRSWNFGDGNNSTAINPTHTYYVIGVYPVTLNVSNVTNCSSSTQSITVTNVSNPPITPPAAPSNIMYVSAAQAGQLNGGINSTVTGLNISRSSRFISNQGPLGSLVNTVTGGVNNGLTLVVLCIGLLAAIVLLRGLDYL